MEKRFKHNLHASVLYYTFLHFQFHFPRV